MLSRSRSSLERGGRYWVHNRARPKARPGGGRSVVGATLFRSQGKKIERVRRKYTVDPGRRVRACLHPCSLKRRKTVRLASAENGRTGSNFEVFREDLGSAVLYSPKKRKLDRRITTNSCRGAGGREPLDYAVVKGRARQTLPIETERRLDRESWGSCSLKRSEREAARGVAINELCRDSLQSRAI